jgi:hypothetical protein
MHNIHDIKSIFSKKCIYIENAMLKGIYEIQIFKL